MGNSFGRNVLATIGSTIQVTADGRPEMKVGGVTIDWTTVGAVSGDTTYLDGMLIEDGTKALRYGQVLTLIGGAEVQTVEFTGGPTSGSAILTLPVSGSDAAQTAVAVAFNAAAVDVEAAINNLSRLGPGGVSIARAGAGSAGSPYVYTITFNRRLGNVPQLTSSNTFAGGTTPSVTHGTTTAGTGTGKWGPYDLAATDGRATLAKGETYIVNETTREDALHSDHPPVLYGGLCFKNRIIATNGTASLADGPTFAALDAAMPRLAYVTES